jgi:hypothetical protein
VIVSGGSRCNWRFFSKHLMKTEENERVTVAEIRGLAGDTVLQGFREMDALASGTRCKNFFYHANINPREDEHLTAEQWELAVDALEKNLGLEGHSRMVVEHEKEGRTHRHVIWSRIDVDSMTAVSDSRNYAAHERTARELERQFGQEPVRGVHGREGAEKRPDRRPKNWETFRGHKSGIEPEEVKAEVTALWRESDSGTAFAAALSESGYVLCRGDKRDFCIIDPSGQEHSLARRVDGVKAAGIRARMADIDRDKLPTVAEGRDRIKAEPPTEAMEERREDKRFERFMQPVVESVAEEGETSLHGMGESWWERMHIVVKERAVQLWQAAKEKWQAFIRDERDEGPKRER